MYTQVTKSHKLINILSAAMGYTEILKEKITINQSVKSTHEIQQLLCKLQKVHLHLQSVIQNKTSQMIDSNI